MSKIAEKLKDVQANIAAACQRTGRDVNDLTLVVVTKTATTENIKDIISLGIRHFGENRVQQLNQVTEEIDQFLLENKENPEIPDSVNWHMIGHLQRNKVKTVLKMLSIVHSLDTLRLAEEINTAAGKLKIVPDVLLQVNCSGEPQKYGVPVGAAVHLAEQIVTMPNLRLVGLMTMAPLTKNKDVVSACFRRGREIFEELRNERHIGKHFTKLSMGMSSDYEIAVEEGATIVRVGTALFT